jgi:sec-independent protein translocase protein TatA
MGIDSPVHLLFVGLIALLVLGPKRLPEVARALGKGIREFRETVGGVTGLGDAVARPPSTSSEAEPQQREER